MVQTLRDKLKALDFVRRAYIEDEADRLHREYLKLKLLKDDIFKKF